MRSLRPTEANSGDHTTQRKRSTAQCLHPSHNGHPQADTTPPRNAGRRTSNAKLTLSSTFAPDTEHLISPTHSRRKVWTAVIANLPNTHLNEYQFHVFHVREVFVTLRDLDSPARPNVRAVRRDFRTVASGDGVLIAVGDMEDVRRAERVPSSASRRRSIAACVGRPDGHVCLRIGRA